MFLMYVFPGIALWLPDYLFGPYIPCLFMSSDQQPTLQDYVDWIQDGRLTSERLVTGCLDRIAETDSEICAWAHLDHDRALGRARQLDDDRRRGKPLGELHGIPVGVEDIFDTSDFPTERGSNIYSGRVPDEDSAVVEKLREAGAVLLGKTVSTELAWMHPAATRNPVDPRRTPGGSSSGSAAAVALAQVPLAVGSQTGGSVIRPASYCGVYGVKPSRGIISRRGALKTSNTLDQVGVFAADLGGAALLIDALGGYDRADSLSYLAPRPRCFTGFKSDVPIEPNFAWIDMPYSDRYSEAVNEGSLELIEALGDQVDRIPAPESFAVLIEAHKVIYDFEIYRALETERGHAHNVSSTFAANMERASGRSDEQYREALEIHEAACEWFREFFNDYDAILTPSAPTEAPPIEQGTGDAICCVIWTLCGLPCISLPLLEGENRLPIGVQLVGGYNEDDRLFRTARWLSDYLLNPET